MDTVPVEIRDAVPGSPDWWLPIMLQRLHDRRTGRSGPRRWTRDQVKSSKLRPPLDLLDDYLRGDPPLREDIHTSWAAPFRQFVRMGRLNTADMCTSPTANRMGIVGFRTAAANDELGDAEAARVMKLNGLKSKSRQVHDYMLGLADGYVMVTPPDDTRDWALITAESPLQCITAEDPATGETLAALKVFRDDQDEADWAYLFLPGQEWGGLWVARMEGPSRLGRRSRFQMGTQWEWVPDKFDTVPGDIVPIFRFRNRNGVGEFENHLDHLDRINDKVFNEWWISKIQAFRQRAIERHKDVEEPDEELDEELDEPARAVDASVSVQETISQMMVSSPDALWDLPPGAKIWESANVDVTPLVNSVQKELQWLAAMLSKPLATLAPDAANQSAEGASTQKEEHLYLIEDRRDRVDSPWSRVMATVFFFQGDTERADASQIEAIWNPIERFSLSQKSDAAQKSKGILPQEAILRDIFQYPAAEIPNLRIMAGKDLMNLPQSPLPRPEPQPTA